MKIETGELAEVVVDGLEGLDRDFREGTSPGFMESRNRKRKQLQELLTESNLKDFSSDDIDELIRCIWGGWTNHELLAAKITGKGAQYVGTKLDEALYETDYITEKFDILHEIPFFGPAAVTEILTFMYPEQCMMYNRKTREAMTYLGFNIPLNLSNGKDYLSFMEHAEELLEEIQEIQLQYSDEPIVKNYLELDYFMQSISSPFLEAKVEETRIQEDELEKMLLELGDSLGFEVTDQYRPGPDIEIDVYWELDVSNLGHIGYAFKIHRDGDKDRALLMLKKAHNIDTSLHKLIMVTDSKEIPGFKRSADAIGHEFTEHITYIEKKRIQEAVQMSTELDTLLRETKLLI